MRNLLTFLGAATLAVTAAFAAGSGMPDPQKAHQIRGNCHLSYDKLAQELKAGNKLPPAEIEWATAHEALGRGGKACAPPPASVVARLTTAPIATETGLGFAALFAKNVKDPAAYSEMGLAALSGKFPDTTAADGLEALKEAARLGDPEALFQMGTVYVSGMLDGKKDHAKGIPMVETAAKAGHIDAMFRMGLFLDNGVGIRKDNARAFDMFRQAAERGHFYATIMAFDMINSGRGTKKDFGLAYRLSRNIADQGEAYGAVMAASSLLQGRDVLKRQDEVLYWMDRAAALGDDKIRAQIVPLRQSAVSIFTRANAPRNYSPPVRKACPMKTVCTTNHYSGLRTCTTNKDYWSDCDG